MAIRKKAAPRRPARKKETLAVELAPARAGAGVDYPQEEEVVSHPSYTIRIGAPEAARVEVSLDDGPWQECRPSAGYWWYDWSGYLPGRHQARAQAHAQDGQILVSPPRQFTVSL